jgi:hypothetical protein
MTYNLNVSMENISRSMSNENKLMASTADQTRQDSKTIKTISIIALVYLPATLISVSALRHIRGQNSLSVVRIQLGACSADLKYQGPCRRVWNIDRCLYTANF